MLQRAGVETDRFSSGAGPLQWLGSALRRDVPEALFQPRSNGLPLAFSELQTPPFSLTENSQVE